jgi:hypothetical protein
MSLQNRQSQIEIVSHRVNYMLSYSLRHFFSQIPSVLAKLILNFHNFLLTMLAFVVFRIFIQQFYLSISLFFFVEERGEKREG